MARFGHDDVFLHLHLLYGDTVQADSKAMSL